VFALLDVSEIGPVHFFTLVPSYGVHVTARLVPFAGVFRLVHLRGSSLFFLQWQVDILNLLWENIFGEVR